MMMGFEDEGEQSFEQRVVHLVQGYGRVRVLRAVLLPRAGQALPVGLNGYLRRDVGLPPEEDG